ncbi:sulfotransferase [Plakobranchus ocellatus]|uniref:Sulfotransferase n=1 Tax=Plakobranchus ocellatus TaxID=259542 RepID=A0AAV3YQ42_9GAST|nr:sulfotransferase [Plakobranchus ocellatus]
MLSMTRMFSGKLSHARLCVLFTFFVLLSFTYLLVQSRGLFTASLASSSTAAAANYYATGASRVGHNVGTHENGRGENMDNITGGRGRKQHALVPTECTVPPQQSEIMKMVRWFLGFSGAIPLSDYVDLFDNAAVTIRKLDELVMKNGTRLYYHHAITGDASVSTLWSNDDWWKNPENCGLTEPRYTNAHHVHKLLPHARIIVILRNPVDRLYSDFLYFQKQDKAQDLFHSSAQKAIASLSQCLDTLSIRSCVYNYTVSSKSRARLRIGLYSVYLNEWLSVFPRDQILVIRLEDYSAKPLTTIRQVNKFLGLKSLSEEEAEDVLEKPVFNRRRASDKKLGKMLPETRDLLKQFYRPYNVELARLLQDERFLWEDGAF